MAKPKLTKIERLALIRVRDGLLAGRYVHDSPYSSRRRKKPVFNMGTVGLYDTFDCGTCGCIGGWVAAELGRQNKLSKYSFASNKAEALCYPHDIDDWFTITPTQAAKAITNFLNDGDPRWPEACRKRRAQR